jgi:transcriptional regulator with PAS, ATPase and Fis domain
MNSSEIQAIKNRFGIIGTSPGLNHAINVAVQVAATDLTVLITGESGSGKESFSKIIHSLSSRKHGPFIAINCGAIPEGTIDSELFGHEKVPLLVPSMPAKAISKPLTAERSFWMK